MAPGAGTRGHEPLSQSLLELLARDSAAPPLTLNAILERTQGRGLYLVMVLLCLPFVVPVSVPGASAVSGGAIMILSLRQVIGKPPRLPRALGERPLPDQLSHRVVSASAKLIGKLEKLIRPRCTHWLETPIATVANGLLIAFMAFLLALPLPSPPFLFTNSLPSYAIILLALCMMERDGLAVWLGYAAAVGACVYFGLWAELITRHLAEWLRLLFILLDSAR
ncbi:MAG: exopolysaccharide biosynthesis protein [Verrucomicrobiae bacterium]|nr:exopolysaccharide biosynthesis protein [Verrucomicrobiae bacterium]MDW7980654.1 exopolysaccharide biosynthesis protein [Verrucomicrobiales bacterium]